MSSSPAGHTGEDRWLGLHASLDGTRVVNYAQWAARADFAALLQDAAARAEMARFAAVAKSVSPALYRIEAIIAA